MYGSSVFQNFCWRFWSAIVVHIHTSRIREMFEMSSSSSKCFHCTHVFDLTNLKGEKRRNVGKELNIINQLANFYDLPVSNLRTFVDSAYEIFVCNQCFNSLKSITESQAKSDKILNNLKNSASSDFKSLTSKLQYQTEKTCTFAETSSTKKRPLHHLVPGRFAPNPVRPLSRFAPNPVRPGSFRPYSCSPRVVLPSFRDRPFNL